MKLLHLHDGNRPSEPDHDARLPLGGLSVPALSAALRAGSRVDERDFDRYLPHELRLVANKFWTPVSVAARAAAWVREFSMREVVDLGSGAGKFCVAAALCETDARYTGVEERPRLVRCADELARTFGVRDRVRFEQGVLGETEVPKGDAYYLFNPFGENLFDESDRLDDSVALGEDRYERDVAATQALLRAAPAGTFVLTYNGFGGAVPSLYEQLRSELELPNPLRLFRKRAPNDR